MSAMIGKLQSSPLVHNNRSHRNNYIHCTHSDIETLATNSGYLIIMSIFIPELACMYVKSVVLVRYWHCYCYSVVSWPEAMTQNTLSDWAYPVFSSLMINVSLSHLTSQISNLQGKTSWHGTIKIGMQQWKKFENKTMWGILSTTLVLSHSFFGGDGGGELWSMKHIEGCPDGSS